MVGAILWRRATIVQVKAVTARCQVSSAWRSRGVAAVTSSGGAVAEDLRGMVDTLGQAVLGGDDEDFEKLTWKLRASCLRNGNADAVSAEDVPALVDSLKHVVLSGDLESFDLLLSRLRPRRDLRTTSPTAAPTPAACATPASSSSQTSRSRSIFSAADVRLSPKDFVWSTHSFNDGDEENARILRSFEDEYARLVASFDGDLKVPELLRATLDLAGAYVKTYALDKADLLFSRVVDECRLRGMPWDVKCLQDLATLRFKQNRQPECAEILEELARRAPPHPATQENLGTVYNSLGNYERALACFQEAVALKGGKPDKEDTWNLAIARKNLGELDTAIPMLQDALERFQSEADKCPVTVAKVHDSLAECYLAAEQSDSAVEQYQMALRLYDKHVGRLSPLYGAAADGLSRSEAAAGRPLEAFDALVDALEVQARMDGIHPTPLYELLERALQLHGGGDRGMADEGGGQDARLCLNRLVPAIQAALENLSQRGLDNDGNGGVVLHKMGQVLLECADEAEHSDLERELCSKALEVLLKAKALMDATMEAGEADLSELCVMAAMQIGIAEARLADAK